MSERVVTFGDRKRLVGTVTPPAPDAPKHDVGFVLLNAGVISRVGPQRLNVTLARALATQGFPAFRFDLSGLGESRPASGTASFEAQAVLDVREAIAWLARDQGVERVVLVGLCSGADNAYATAREEERVAGLVLLDPWAYPDWRSKLRANLLRLKRPGRFASLMRRAHRVVMRLDGAIEKLIGRRAKYNPGDDGDRVAPAPAEFERTLAALADRGCATYLLYSGSVTHAYNDGRQFARVFGAALAERVRVEFEPEVNHTRTELHAQRALVDKLLQWAAERYAR